MVNFCFTILFVKTQQLGSILVKSFYKTFSFFFQNKQSEEEESAPTDEGIYDSVELSFMGKLEKADKKDTEDQRVFELLEEAALDFLFHIHKLIFLFEINEFWACRIRVNI